MATTILDHNDKQELEQKIATNTEARHTHNNKDILDKFGINTAKTRPTFNDGLTDEVLATQHDVTSRVNELRATVPNSATVEGNTLKMQRKVGTGDIGTDLFSVELPESGGNVDLSGYAKTEDVPTKTSELKNDSSFITETECDTKISSLKEELIDDAPNNGNTFGKLYGTFGTAITTLEGRIDTLEGYEHHTAEKMAVLDVLLSEEIQNELDDTVQKKHTHDNKDTLDNIDNLFVRKEDVSTEIETALAEAKESGEFDGADGQDGKNGVDGADGYTPVKGTDYFTEADKAEMVEEVTASLNDIPAYWQAALDEGVEAINTAMTNAGYNKSAFLFYSDAHWDYGSQMSPKLLKYLYQHTAMTKTNFGGDIVNDEATDYDTMSYLWDWRNQLKDLPNHHSVVGNHDDGNSTNNLFSEQYVYGYLLAAEETPDIVRGDSGLYYYIDHSPEKTRYLYLDTAYKGVNDKQQAFVKDALLSTPEGWHIVAISHIWHDTVYNGALREVGELNANASILLSMFDNYNSRIGGYAECGGWVEFCIGGHTHLDHDSTSSTGIPIILVATDSQHTGGVNFTYGTDTEASVNGIVADYDNHKIYVVRIGRGESREIEVTNYVVTYTNVLTTALDTDESIYNGVGYKADTRWSTSSGGEKNESGIYISGYIPVSTGDIIRVKNIEMDKNNTITNACMVMFYSALGVHCGNHGASDLTTYQNAIWDENGMLTQFTIQGMEMSYIRLQASYIGENSIITINEPIE